jgi:uracil phosphoribosyltransferase
MKNVAIVDHPFVIDSLTHLRDKNTSLAKFRRHSDQICQFLFAEAIRGLDFKTCQIETPLNIKINSRKLKDEIVVVSVLRAGLAMLFSAIKLLPKSRIGCVGLERDEKTAVAHPYYWKLPPINENSIVIVTDPMLATGGSMAQVLDYLAKEKAKEIRAVCVVAAPEGIKLVNSKFPQVKIFTAAVDEKLNDIKYIMPGIGDYGDRYFGTC